MLAIFNDYLEVNEKFSYKVEGISSKKLEALMYIDEYVYEFRD